MKRIDTLNTLINHIVFTIDNLFKGKESSQELLDYLYLIVAGMIITYGEDFIENIYANIDTINFKLANSNDNINNQLFYKNPCYHNYQNKIINFDNKSKPNLTYELQFYKINSSGIKTLEYLTHEINFILFNKQPLTITENIAIRWNYLTNKTMPLNLTYSKDKTINKIFNVLQTEEIIKEILNLKNSNIRNIKFKKAMVNIENIDYNIYKTEGQNILTNLLRPLYNLNDIKKLINSPNNQKLIEKELDNVLGKNSYKEICQKIESLEYQINNSNNNTNYYYLSLEYVEIKKDYINRYINHKYA